MNRKTSARARRIIEQRAASGEAEARFALNFINRRDAGYSPFGDRFRAWLRSSGMSDADIEAEIAKLEGRD
jgi:hypothetical protein